VTRSRRADEALNAVAKGGLVAAAIAD